MTSEIVYTAQDARQAWGRITNRIRYEGKATPITYHGKPLAEVVPHDWFVRAAAAIGYPDGIGMPAGAHRAESSPPAAPDCDCDQQAEECPMGSLCTSVAFGGSPEKKEINDWCGHDSVGHRMTNTLHQQGYDTLAKVLAADPAVLLDLPNFGPGSYQRFTERKARTDGSA